MKKVLIGVGVLIVIIVIVLIVGLSKLGPIIKTAVNTYGPKITKTNVSLADVGVSLLGGEVKIKGFVLGNPKGFSSPDAVKVGSIYVKVDEKSLTGNTIIIDKIEVIAPEITYERSASRDNFKQILENVQGSTPSGKTTSEQKPAETGGGKKIIIRDFILKDGKVDLATSLLAGQSVSAQLPEIRLKDLGQDKGGATPAQVFGQVFDAIYKQISSPQITQALNDKLKSLSGQARQDLEKAGENMKSAAGDQVKQAAEKGLKDVTEGVKGLLGK